METTRLQNLISKHEVNAGDLVNHLFLPKRLPQKEEANLSDIEQALLEYLNVSAKPLLENICLPTTEYTLTTWSNLQDGSSKLNESLEALKVGESACLYVRKQNCTILFTKLNEAYMRIVTFRASFPSKDITGTCGSLKVTYPETVDVVPISSLLLSPCLAQQLEHLLQETYRIAMPTSSKAGMSHVETREPSNPFMISDFLVSMLCPTDSTNFGTAVVETGIEKLKFQKKLRDQVNWKDCLYPFRRSGLWMSAKVILQLSLQEEMKSISEAYVMYKIIILNMLTSILEDWNEYASWDVTAQMLAKLARRGKKLSEIAVKENSYLESQQEKTLNRLWLLIEDSHKSISSSWQSFAQWSSQVPQIQHINRSEKEWLQDCVHHMDKLTTYLNINRIPTSRPTSIDNLSMIDSIQDTQTVSLDNLLVRRTSSSSPSQDVHLNAKSIWLYQVEWFVRNKLNKNQSPKNIYELMTSYVKTAFSLYGTTYADPVYYSRLTITVFKFVMVLDQIAVEAYPLLRTYKTGIQVEMFDCLLIPEKCDMLLVENLQNYFSQRNSYAESDFWLGKSDISRSDFAVKFAQSDLSMQDLKWKILEKMGVEIEAKKDEIQRVRRSCDDLRQQISRLTCTQKWDPYLGSTTHINCRFCKLKSQLGSKKKSVKRYQRPLPPEDYLRNAIVFEFLIPQKIAVLRESVLILLQDILGYSDVLFVSKIEENQIHTKWTAFNDLQIWPKNGHQRIYHLGSQHKDTMSSHYGSAKKRNQNPDVTIHHEDSFILENGLNCKYFRTSSSVDKTPVNPFVMKIAQAEISESRSYQTLQFSMESVRPSENEVIAKQYKCHEKITLKEFKVFGSLRSAPLIQLRNLYAGIATKVLSLEKEPVLQLIMQTIWELGPGNREIHVDFELEENKPFLLAFLEVLNTSLEENSLNWSNPMVTLSLTTITIRILEMSGCPEIKEIASRLLQKIRQVLEEWCLKLEQLLVTPAYEKDAKTLMGLLLKCAICCTFTFNVSSRDNISFVFKDPSDITAFLKAQSRLHHLVIRENVLVINPPSKFMQNLLRHGRQGIPLNLQEHLHKALSQPGFKSSIHDFVCSKWFAAHNLQSNEIPPFQNFVLTSKKHAYQAEYCLSSNIHKVCVDTLRGTFFVDGYPPSVLPETITRSPLYKSFFLTSQFRVQKDSRTFRSKDKYRGLLFEFTEAHNRLIIRQQSSRGNWFELLPRELLEDKVGHELISNYTHWFDSRTKFVYFRRPSTSDTEESIEHDTDFVLVPVPSGKPLLSGQWYLRKYTGSKSISSCHLLFVHSTGFQMITKNLQKLESQNFIHVLMEHSDGTISANLRRHNLKFYLDQNHGLLHCENYPGYYIPVSRQGEQNLETLIGLQSGIVLEKVTEAEPGGKKKFFIIQHGTLSISHHEDRLHQSVVVIGDEMRSPAYFVFEVDQVLKRLRPGNNKSAWLYLALLHGATSSPFPDPFIQLTGSEMAIWILQSGFSWSCSPYDEEGLITLEQISGLSPKYDYYPGHLKVMQTIKWPTGLGKNSYAAYDGYGLIVKKLLEDSIRIAGMFTGIEASDPSKIDNCWELCWRSYHRNINFYNKSSRLSAQFLEQSEDKSEMHTNSSHSSRLRKSDGELATLAEYRRKNIPSSNAETITSFIIVGEQLPPQVDTGLAADFLSAWLTTDLRQEWLQMYFWALNVTSQNTEHELTLTLGAMLYSNKGTLKQLLNIHNIAISRNYIPTNFPTPPVSLTKRNYDPLDYKLVSSKIIDILKGAAVEPPYEYGFLTYEDYISAKNQYQVSLREELSLAAESLKLQYWPMRSIDEQSLKKVLKGPSFRIGSSRLLKYEDSVHQDINYVLRSWYNNFLLKRFIGKVDAKMMEIKNGGLARELRPKRLKEWNIKFESTADRIDKWLKEGNFFERGAEPRTTERDIILTGQLGPGSCESLNEERHECIQLVDTLSKKLYSCVNADSSSNLALTWAGLHARLAPVVLLRDQFAKGSNQMLTEATSYIGGLAVAWAHLKRLNRLITYESDKEKYSVELERERKTLQCSNWNPSDNPEWLLLELELDITIRPVQVDVARRMMNMPREKNGVMQLNMGEGKTSVIIPMIVATLSSSANDFLCRVTVLNSIYATNYNLLASTIGGLLNKRLYTVPCSRDLKIGVHVEQVQKIYEECLRMKGAVITLPEYRLSFRLQMYNSFLQDGNGHADVGSKIYQTESWLRKHARDLVDESDEIFSVKYQLIYATGRQKPIDGGSMRWRVCQKLLGFLPKVAVKLSRKYGTKAIEFKPEVASKHPERFTHLRILGDECQKEFYEMVANGILDGKINLFGGILRKNERKIVKEFLINENISEDDHKKFFQIEGISSERRSALLLVSGYLRRGVFFTALKKRWRVEYGVKQSEGKSEAKLIAIPFRAKDVAAERTEFGHPDMAIVLTQLSYYYSGLSDQQLFQCFKILETRVTGPAGVYNSWIMEIPASKIKSESVKTYNGINLKDYEQRTSHLFPLLRKHKAVIDFWLENAVFPNECKQFPRKLVTNAWDLCYDKCEHPTTGFSGTNDTSLLLPAQITQQDLEFLLSTNERVEGTLRKRENQLKRSMTMGVGCKEILQCMTLDGLRVLIDAGALMLELGNQEIAELWLEVDQSLEAVVYFNEDGEMVTKIRRHTEYQKRSKGEKDQLLTLSPLKDRLENCAVYLDDQHTRATDITLPTNFKACVTVGSGMRRDKLIQACMRMRKLGSGQSVHFYLSHEVQNKICANTNVNPTVGDIINWAKENSRQFEKDGLLYWTTNARNYAKNLAADELFELSPKSKGFGKRLAKLCEDPDAQELEVMYGTYHRRDFVTSMIPRWFESIRQRLATNSTIVLPTSVIKMLKVIEDKVFRKCKANIPTTTFFHSMLEEEQEKELEPELEVEKERHLPSSEAPLKPLLHRNVIYCVKSLQTATVFDGISRLSDIFRNTTVQPRIQWDGWGAHCFATEDFIKVVRMNNSSRGNHTDSFLKSIQFFVSFNNGVGTTVLLLSLHEVNGLISYIRGKQCLPGTTLHMFSGRLMDGQPIFANDSRLQLPIRKDSRRIRLDDNVLAPLLIAAGNLYFSGISEEKAFARFLGLRLRPWTEGEEKAFQEKRITNTGFVLPLCPILREGCSFKEDPTKMVMAVLRMRNDVLRDSDHTVAILESCSSIFVAGEINRDSSFMELSRSMGELLLNN